MHDNFNSKFDLPEKIVVVEATNASGNGRSSNESFLEQCPTCLVARNANIRLTGVMNNKEVKVLSIQCLME